MDKDSLNAVRADLEKLMKVHGIRNASFCGTGAEGGYWGLMSVQEHQDAPGLFESVLNIGQLWQHTRETVRSILDDFEK